MTGNGTYSTGGPSTATVPSLDELVRIFREVEAERARVDANTAKALREHITRGSVPVAEWARRLGVSGNELLDVMHSAKPISAALYAAIERAFGPPAKPAG